MIYLRVLELPFLDRVFFHDLLQNAEERKIQFQKRIFTERNSTYRLKSKSCTNISDRMYFNKRERMPPWTQKKVWQLCKRVSVPKCFHKQERLDERLRLHRISLKTDEREWKLGLICCTNLAQCSLSRPLIDPPQLLGLFYIKNMGCESRWSSSFSLCVWQHMRLKSIICNISRNSVKILWNNFSSYNS